VKARRTFCRAISVYALSVVFGPGGGERHELRT
jgi:hypothetical protein